MAGSPCSTRFARLCDAQDFEPLARELFSTHGVQVRTADGSRLLYRIEEVEFYMFEREAHPDPFCHAADVQEHSGTWYFHMQGRGYKEGSYKGLDVTFGPPRVRGGMLVRSVRQDFGERRAIEGPSLVVDEMLRARGLGKARDLVAELQGAPAGLGVWDERSALSLAPIGTLAEALRLFRSPRVGLSLRKTKTAGTAFELRRAFVFREYRFLAHPRPKNGGVHLFCAMFREAMASERSAHADGSIDRAFGQVLDKAADQVSDNAVDRILDKAVDRVLEKVLYGGPTSPARRDAVRRTFLRWAAQIARGMAGAASDATFMGSDLGRSGEYALFFGHCLK